MHVETEFDNDTILAFGKNVITGLHCIITNYVTEQIGL